MNPDLVFFLLDIQLDRTSWQWQQIQSSRYVMEYTGVAKNGLTVEASLEDFLRMCGSASDIKIPTAMITEGALLCYRY